MKERRKQEKAITLIALVITIIILLILAGVSIATLAGDNGILTKAKEAKDKTSISEAKEKIELAIMDLRIEEESIGKKLSKDSLDKLNNGQIMVESTESFPVEVIFDKYKFEVDEDFKVKYVGEIDGTIVTYTIEPKGYTNQNQITILMKIVNPKGIKTVEYPNGDIIVYDGKTEITREYLVTQNGVYTFKIVDNENKEVIKDIVIQKIDNLPPTDIEVKLEKISSGLKIVVDANDAEATEESVKSGIVKYEYYVKVGNDSDYTIHESSTNSHIIPKVKINVEYTIYVKAYDGAGNSPVTSETQVYMDSIMWDAKASSQYDGTFPPINAIPRSS